jgi:phosphoglycolate phosphatase-like HAD superfamily hydrolase
VLSKDVAAAVLRDVDGLTNREIGDMLGVPLPNDFRIKADHPTVRKMVGRGRRALNAALGEDGWKAQVRGMKEEAKRWRSMSATQRQAELEAEALGVPYEEVLERLQEELRGSSGEDSEHGIQEEVAF